MAANPKGIVNIHGKDYETVASRVARFRDAYPEHTIETQLIHQDDERVIMKALILNGELLLATGYAEEVRGSSNINSTSALENCETSAIGRCLAAFGYMGTDSYATADEVAAAIAQQKIAEATRELKEHNLAWIRHEESLISIRAHCHNGNFSAAWEEWNEIPEEDRMVLKVAPTKGGWMDQVTKKGLTQGSAEDFDAERGVYRSVADRKDDE
jgi:hypothetical protein